MNTDRLVTPVTPVTPVTMDETEIPGLWLGAYRWP